MFCLPYWSASFIFIHLFLQIFQTLLKYFCISLPAIFFYPFNNQYIRRNKYVRYMYSNSEILVSIYLASTSSEEYFDRESGLNVSRFVTFHLGYFQVIAIRSNFSSR